MKREYTRPEYVLTEEFTEAVVKHEMAMQYFDPFIEEKYKKAAKQMFKWYAYPGEKISEYKFK